MEEGEGERREEKSKGTYLAHFGLPLPQSAQNSLPEMEYSSLEIFTRLLGFLRSRHNPNYPKDQKPGERQTVSFLPQMSGYEAKEHSTHLRGGGLGSCLASPSAARVECIASLSGVRERLWRAWTMALFSTSIQHCMSGCVCGGSKSNYVNRLVTSTTKHIQTTQLYILVCTELS